jgi:DNA gyrase/topoisomerase IV subunit B
MKNKSYTGKDIVELTDREHVRLRTQVYLGNMHPTLFNIPKLDSDKLEIESVEFVPAVYKAVGEIIDNSIDEFAQIKNSTKTLTIDCEPENGKYTINDTGRGIPIDRRPDGTYTPEIALSRLRAGRNFKNEKEVGVIGMNGVGAACTNYCSTKFKVIVKRDNQTYTQTFEDGALKISEPSLRQTKSDKTGTEISFELDKRVFKDVYIPFSVMKNRAIEIALTNPDVSVIFNGEKIKYKNGFKEYLDKIAPEKYFPFSIKTENVQGTFYVITDCIENIDEQMFTWVNSSYLFDGGKCNTQFVNAFFEKTISHLQNAAKKNKSDITRNDVRENLVVFANLKIKNPEYDSQSKTRLTGPDLRKEINEAIDSQWKNFVRKNNPWLDVVLERAIQRHHTQANKKAIEEHQKQLKKRVPGLLDATSQIRSECQLLITEGMCLDERTPIKILSSEGLVDIPLKNVNIGDTVITHKNNLKPITNITRTLKRGTRITTSIGQVVCSDQHRWLVYDTITHKFDWAPTNALNANVHKLVRSRLGDWVYCAEFVIENNKDADNIVYPRVIITAFEKIKTSLTHTFIVLDTDTYAVVEIPFSELDPSHHLMLLFKSKK